MSDSDFEPDPYLLARFPPALTTLLVGFGYNETNPKKRTSKTLGTLVFGYGVSLMKASGFTKEDVLTRISSIWEQLQGGPG